jgi:putative oxidoreductase
MRYPGDVLRQLGEDAFVDDVAQAAAGPRADTRPAPEAGQRRAHPLRRLVLGLLTAAVFTVIIVYGRHTLARSLHVLDDANPGWLLLALVVEAGSLSVFGLSRTLLLRANSHRPGARRIRFREVMVVTYAANALSLSVPFAGAELAVVYSYREFRKHGTDSATTSWSLGVSALFSTSALAFVLLLGAAVGGWSAGTAAALGGALVYLVPGAGVLLALRYNRVRAVAQHVLARLAELSRRVFGKPENGAEGLEAFLDEVSSTGLPWSRYARIFALAAANWLLDCAALACAIRAMGQPVPWRDLLLVYGAGAAVGSTGITPGGFGLVELALAAALTASGLSASHALAAVLAYRLVNFWLVVAAGWVCVTVLARRSPRVPSDLPAGPACRDKQYRAEKASLTEARSTQEPVCPQECRTYTTCSFPAALTNPAGRSRPRPVRGAITGMGTAPSAYSAADHAFRPADRGAMTTTRRMLAPLRPAARVLTGSTYALLGFDALRAPGGRVDQAGPLLAQIRKVAPLPDDDELIVRGNAAVQVVAGGLLALGIAPRLSALALAGSLVPTTLAGHSYWTIEDPAARKAQRIQFHKNMAMIGGLLFAALDEP